MQRQKATFHIAAGQQKETKTKMLNWANRFSILVFLDSNNYSDTFGRYEYMLAAGVAKAHTASSLAELQQLHDTKKDWLFGHICYDYKNALEPKLSSSHTPRMGFSDLHFFCPQVVCYITRDTQKLIIESHDADPKDVYAQIMDSPVEPPTQVPSLQFTQRIDKANYLATIAKLRQHIADGDCYEINFCNEGYCENTQVDPLAVFHALNTLSPAPFAAYYKLNDAHMMCASPERYIHKAGQRILSQPIKGTARRDADTHKDAVIKEQLYNSIKDRAENVMIVDLVRNDISRSAEIGSVHVDELFGIYTFPQVHQMISTVSGQLKTGLPFTHAIRNSFPMGSMTGAPKVKVMQLIEQYEKARRQLFSGTVGYITPEGDFDFNVIIRSLFYNAATQYLSYQTGGAITYDSTPEQEYEEMRLKAWALERIFAS